MKKYFTSFLVICMLFSVNAQTNVFQPYDLNNAEWYYQSTVFDGSNTNYYYDHKHWGGDTTIQGQAYVKTDAGAIRQDIANQTLFFRDLSGQEFDISIDQFMEIGDTLFLTPNIEVATGVDLSSYFYEDSFAVISAIDSISFMGNYRKSYVFHLDNNPQAPEIELVLGLGVIQATGFEHGDMLICYSTDNQLQYGASENPLSINCTAGSTELEKIDFTIYPNPAKEQIKLHFDLSNGTIDRIVVTDLHGKQLTEIRSPLTHTEIAISSWEDGVYLVSLESNGFVSQKKFIKLR